MLKNSDPKLVWVTGQTKNHFEQLRRPNEQLYQTIERVATSAAKRQKGKPNDNAQEKGPSD